jgi:hypothetical protein
MIGLVMALLLAPLDRPPIKRYDWEDEDDEDHESVDPSGAAPSRQPWREWD